VKPRIQSMKPFQAERKRVRLNGGRKIISKLDEYQGVLDGIGVHPQWGKHVFQGVHGRRAGGNEGEDSKAEGLANGRYLSDLLAPRGNIIYVQGWQVNGTVSITSR